MKTFWLVIGIVASSVIFFNNAKQLYEGITNIKDVIAFLISTGVVTWYYYVNKGKI